MKVRNTLTLHAYMHTHGASLNENRRAIAFKVKGLAIGEEAWIAEFNHRWKILRASAGVQGEWQGKYRDPAEAMAALQAVS
jgi:hypothetical protein